MDETNQVVSTKQNMSKDKKSFIQRTVYYSIYKKVITSTSFQYTWALSLIFFGLGYIFFFDSFFRWYVNVTMGINTNLYDTPHYDQAAALNPVVGVILLVGGLILWYLPNDSHNTE